MSSLWGRFDRFLRLYDGVQLTLSVILTIGGVGWNAALFLWAHFTNTDFKQLVPEVTRTELLIQAVVIAILAFSPAELYLVREDDGHDRRVDRAIEAAHQFAFVWSLVWYCWCAMYIVIALEAFDQFFHEGVYTFLVRDLLDLAVTDLLFLCYLLLIRESVYGQRERWQRDVGKVIGGSAIFMVIEALIVIKHPEAHRAFASIQGLLSGVGLALLVGRLEGRFINTPRYMVVLFYGYAVIQLGYGEFDDPVAKPIITTAALILKVLLFFEFWRIITTPTLIYYMYRYKQLKDEVKQDRQNFETLISPPPHQPRSKRRPRRPQPPEDSGLEESITSG